MTRYLDSSVIVNLIFGESVPTAWDQTEPICISRLAGVEVRRTFLRLHTERRLTDVQLAGAAASLSEIERVASIAAVSEPTLLRASQAFPTAVRTLDAIHLSTAMQLREGRFPDLTFATHDRRLAVAARALEFVVYGAE